MSQASEAMISPAHVHVADQSTTRKKADFFIRMKKWIIGATSVLVLVPSLIIGVKDIYRELAGNPRTPQEVINTRNFENYDPTAMQLKEELTWDGSEHAVTVEVHEGGKILVRYGSNSLWFESPDNQVPVEPKSSVLDLFVSVLNIFTSPAQADGLPVDQPQILARRTVKKRALIAYESYFEDGIVKTKTVDKRTGQWSSPKTDRWTSLPTDAEKLVR